MRRWRVQASSTTAVSHWSPFQNCPAGCRGGVCAHVHVRPHAAGGRTPSRVRACRSRSMVCVSHCALALRCDSVPTDTAKSHCANLAVNGRIHSHRYVHHLSPFGGFSFHDAVISDDRRQIIIELYAAGQEKRDIPGAHSPSIACLPVCHPKQRQFTQRRSSWRRCIVRRTGWCRFRTILGRVRQSDSRRRRHPPWALHRGTAMYVCLLRQVSTRSTWRMWSGCASGRRSISLR